MTPTVTPDLHRVPLGAVVVRPDICGNCATRLYLRKGQKQLCNNCAPLLEIKDGQVWQCLDCGAHRIWGLGQPDETRGKYLRCGRCHGVSLHDFVRISNGC